jgi:hypothetical protein
MATSIGNGRGISKHDHYSSYYVFFLHSQSVVTWCKVETVITDLQHTPNAYFQNLSLNDTEFPKLCECTTLEIII